MFEIYFWGYQNILEDYQKLSRFSNFQITSIIFILNLVSIMVNSQRIHFQKNEIVF